MLLEGKENIRVKRCIEMEGNQYFIEKNSLG